MASNQKTILENNLDNIVNDKEVRMYDVFSQRHNTYLHKGYNYEGNIFKKTVASFILADPNKKDILSKIERVIFTLIEDVKKIKMFVNFTENKNAKHIN